MERYETIPQGSIGEPASARLGRGVSAHTLPRAAPDEPGERIKLAELRTMALALGFAGLVFGMAWYALALGSDRHGDTADLVPPEHEPSLDDVFAKRLAPVSPAEPTSDVRVPSPVDAVPLPDRQARVEPRPLAESPPVPPSRVEPPDFPSGPTDVRARPEPRDFPPARAEPRSNSPSKPRPREAKRGRPDFETPIMPE